jgi:hypothetical protein
MMDTIQIVPEISNMPDALEMPNIQNGRVLPPSIYSFFEFVALFRRTMPMEETITR